jgi:hypothetical protein
MLTADILRPREIVCAVTRPLVPLRSPVSSDEKSQIQALDRTQPGLPTKKGRAVP